MDQRIQHVRLTGGVSIAYAVVGSGPFLIVPPPWVSHLELAWAIPPERRFWEALAAHRTVVRYDRPGTGLSGGALIPPSLGAELAFIDAVASAVGATRFDLLGTSLAAGVAAAWTAAHVARVDRLVLYGGWARGADIASPVMRDHVLGVVQTHWGFGSEVLADIFVPEADRRIKEALVSYQRESATSQVALAILRFGYELDVVEHLSRITAPTLVLHRDKDRAVPIEQGRFLAQSIRGSRFQPLSGRSHLPYVGDQDAVLTAVRRFLGFKPSRRTANPTLTGRQLEVAGLIARGLTNKAIAQILSIDERSVEGHLDRIRDRLGLTSRAALAAWFVASQG
jgi:pimeloyl-ACP methyl ester carboxylesterase/DNA-binding CsgD family transcriptional regulator